MERSPLSTSVPSRASAWLLARRRPLLLALVTAAALVRAAYFVQLSSGPCLSLHRWDNTDMSYFHQWATQVATGDWLSARLEPPKHKWYRDVAVKYLLEHPAERAALAAERGPGADLGTALWERWSGPHRFYVDPLYPYLVALTYRVAGPDPRWVFAWQLLAGVLTTLLVVAITNRFFGVTAAALAGVLTAGYAPLVYYEALLLRETLVVLASFGLVLLLVRALEHDRPARWAALGAASGLTFLLKSTFVLEVLLLAAGGALFQARGPSRLRTAARRLGPFAGALALALVPLVVRNLLVGAPALSLASGGAATFVSGNEAEYDASFPSVFIPERLGEIMAASGGSFLSAVLETLRTHDGFMSYAHQLWAKFSSAWSWYEPPNNTSFYFFRQSSSVLRALPFTFALVAPLGLVGWALSLKRARDRWPLHVLVATGLVPPVAFYVVSRLRLPLAAAMLPFAAYALAWMAERLAERTRRSAGAAAAGVLATALLAAWTNRSLPPGQPLIRPADYDVTLLVHYDEAVNRAAAAGDWSGAARIAEQYLRYEPPFPRLADPGWVPTQLERGMLEAFATAHATHADLLERAGEPGAGEERERAARMTSAARPAAPR